MAPPTFTAPATLFTRPTGASAYVRSELAIFAGGLVLAVAGSASGYYGLRQVLSMGWPGVLLVTVLYLSMVAYGGAAAYRTVRNRHRSASLTAAFVDQGWARAQVPKRARRGFATELAPPRRFWAPTRLASVRWTGDPDTYLLLYAVGPRLRATANFGCSSREAAVALYSAAQRLDGVHVEVSGHQVNVYEESEGWRPQTLEHLGSLPARVCAAASS